MQYIVMSRVGLENFQKGYSERINGLFYQSAYLDEDKNLRHTWTPCLGLSKQFVSEETAWDFLKATWGLRFAHTNFVVISVHHEAIHQSMKSADKIVHGKEAL